MLAKDIQTLMVQYEQKRRDANINLENRKEKIYKKNPRLKEIEDEINKISINKTKNILTNSLSAEGENKFEEEILKLKQERSKILKSENIDENFFKPHYECEKCKDTGYINYKDKKTVMCNCLKQKLIDISYNKSNLKNVQKENFNNSLSHNKYYFAE